MSAKDKSVDFQGIMNTSEGMSPLEIDFTKRNPPAYLVVAAITSWTASRNKRVKDIHLANISYAGIARTRRSKHTESAMIACHAGDEDRTTNNMADTLSSIHLM